MYAQVEKSKENKSRAVVRSVVQKKFYTNKENSFLDNRNRNEFQNYHSLTKQLSSKGNCQRKNVIQLAGHDGVMIFKKDRIVKRVEKTEYNLFKEIKCGQGDGDPAFDIFPEVFNYWERQEINLSYLVSKGYSEDKVKTFLKLACNEGDNYFIEMENLTQSESDTQQQRQERGEMLRDYKIGKFTAERNELLRNGHKNKLKEAISKEQDMMNYNDVTSETSKFGIRDEDEFKKRFKLTVPLQLETITLLRIKNRIKKNGVYKENDRAVVDLNNIAKVIELANIAYVASSLAFFENNDRQKERVKLIDLAHPINKTKKEPFYLEAKEGMLLGIENLIRILTGKNMKETTPFGQGKDPKVYPINYDFQSKV